MASTNLDVVSSGKFIGVPDGIVVSVNPKMDLLAVSMNRMSIWVFRLDGERVYSVNNRSQITHLCWNASGKFFAVSGSDGLVKVYDSNDGTLVNKFSTDTSLSITLTAWASVDIDKSIGNDEFSPYLNMFKMDVLKLMPKLSNEVSQVSTHASTGMVPPESLLKSLHPMSASVTSTADDESALDYLLVVSSNSLLSVTFNNLFTVLDIQLPGPCTYLRHAMAQDMLSQYFLARDPDGLLLLYGFRFDVSPLVRRKHIFDLIRWCSHLTSILNHVTDQIAHLETTAANFYAYFDRQLSNLKDLLYENVDLTTNFPTRQEVDDDIVKMLVKAFLTGEIPESLHDFWMNQFGQRALVRLSEEGNSLFDNVRKTVFAQVILGFEKAIVLLSEIEAVIKAAYDLYEETYHIKKTTLTEALLKAADIIERVYDFIWQINLEQEHFNLFLSWIKVEVLEKLSKMENDPELFLRDHPQVDATGPEVLDFIDKLLLNPVMGDFFNVDLLANEVLLPRSLEEKSLDDDVKELRDLVQTELLPGFQKYISEVSCFDELLKLPIDLSSGTWGLHLDQETLIVPYSTKNSISVVYFSKEKLVSRTDISVDGEVMSFELIDAGRLVVLVKNVHGMHQLKVVSLPQTHGRYSANDLLLTQDFDFDAASPIAEPSRLSVSTSDTPQKTLICVLGGTKRDFMLFKVAG